jgi:Chaperone of endosialidase
MKTKNMTTPPTKKSINWSPLRLGFILITLLLACFALSQRAQGVVPPPPGGYPNFTTAAGDNALQALTSGVGNTALGTFSLFSVTTGSFNTAVGAGSLDLNTADSNTATGAAALLFNTTGTQNTAVGTAALELNDSGNYNDAVGAFALFHNTTGNSNTANGYQALLSTTTGSNNTANGVNALLSNTIGSHNIALGDSAGYFVTSGDFNIDIGNVGVASDSNTIRIGDEGSQARTFIAAIRGRTTGVADAIPVLIDSNGQLGTISSSRRFKKEIKAMEQASEAILSLKPVTFHYKSDTKDTPQFGLIAEEVAEVNPDLVVRDENGEIYTVRYEAVNAMLLNEFLKEHRKVEELTKDFQATVAQQQKEIQALTAAVKEQAAQIQKVSAQLATASPSRGGLEASKPAPQVVNNP